MGARASSVWTTRPALSALDAATGVASGLKPTTVKTPTISSVAPVRRIGAIHSERRDTADHSAEGCAKRRCCCTLLIRLVTFLARAQACAEKHPRGHSPAGKTLSWGQLKRLLVGAVPLQPFLWLCVQWRCRSTNTTRRPNTFQTCDGPFHVYSSRLTALRRRRRSQATGGGKYSAAVTSRNASKIDGM